MGETPGGEQRNREQGQVGEGVEDPRRVVQQLIGLLNSHAHLPRQREDRRHRADEEDRVHRGAEAGMEPGEPRREPAVPPGDHGEAGIPGEDQRHVPDLPQEQQENKRRDH